MDDKYIVVFDGVCNFCNGAVHFIIKRDPKMQFMFAPMQTDFAKQLMSEYGISNAGVDTFLLIKNGQSYVFSTAALEIARDLNGYWFLFNAFRALPSSIRDFFYKTFARNRYALFGRQENCMIPTAELKSRFLGLE